MTLQAKAWDQKTRKFIFRWIVTTSDGRKITWAADQDHARRKVEINGFDFIAIEPAGSGQLP